MKTHNSITKKISKEDLKITVNDQLKLLEEFLNDVVIKFTKEYIHES